MTKGAAHTILKEYVEEQISVEPDSRFAIIYTDIDDFKTINDNFGTSKVTSSWWK